MSGVLALAIAIGGVLSVTASNVSRTQIGPTPDGTVTSIASPNTTPVGGLLPYVSFSWVRISGSTDITVVDGTLQNPTWTGAIESGFPQSAVWRVTVTDTLGNTASADITVTLTWVQI